MQENKLNHIEETLTHQEQQIHELSDIVTSQWKEIELLKKRMVKMQSKLDIIEDGGDSESMSITEQAERDKPPHY